MQTEPAVYEFFETVGGSMKKKEVILTFDDSNGNVLWSAWY
jgi:hypothetical protein